MDPDQWPGRDGELVFPAGWRAFVARALYLGFPVRATSLSPDGKLAGFGGAEGSVSVGSLPDMKEIFTGRHEKFISNVRFSEDSRLLLTSSSDATAKLWNLQIGELLFSLPHDAKVSYARLFDNDRRIVTGDYSGNVTVRDALRERQ